jgi:hypothetical protein
MTNFGKTLFSGSRFMFWALAPFIMIFLIMMTIIIPVVNSKLNCIQIVLFAFFWITGISLILGLFNSERYSWAFRIVTAMIFLLFLGYTVYELWEHEGILPLPKARSEDCPINALLGLIIVGIPSLAYTIFGRFTFRQKPPDENPDEDIEHNE